MNFARFWIFGPNQVFRKKIIWVIDFFGYGWFRLHNSNTYKIYVIFVRNRYGSVQIFRTQIKLDKHKNTKNTKNIQNLNKIPEKSENTQKT